MLEDYEKKKRKQVSNMRAMLDYTMGIVFITIGLFFLFRGRINTVLNDYLRDPDLLDKVLGVMSLLYGVWRIYRGYKKNYF
ncbi:MAG: hypothetical protein HOP10_00200 [Chitinophagaceae bacterium]|nr:hypothetical protein [Chitinophagaceae bacterium]